MAIDPQILATILNDYNTARSVIGWLADNDLLVGVDLKKPGWRDLVDRKAREFAVGTGPATLNYKAAIFDKLMGD